MVFPLGKLKTDDSDLIIHLKKSNSFSFLQEQTKNKINDKLKQRKKNSPHALNAQHETLRELWKAVLTDALLSLKKMDSRESGDKPDDYETFFHEESLGIEELEEILTGFVDAESLMYGASPNRYRDHLAHVFRVWILGHALLKNHLNGQLDPPSPELGVISNEEWECMWAITALCHDLGYPLESVEWINKKCRGSLESLGLVSSGDLRFFFSQQMLPFHDTAIKIIASKIVLARLSEHRKSDEKYLTHIQNKYYLKLLKSFDQLSHGIVSSLLLCRSSVYFLESEFCHDSYEPLEKKDARQFLIRREILRAIAAHTCPDIYHVKFNTLSFLLYMVDEIQCWGRPTFEELQQRPSTNKTGATTDVAINTYTANEIDVEIDMHGDKFNDDDKKKVMNQLNTFHRILRLALDTPKMKESELNLRFAVVNGKVTAEFLLSKGTITKKPDGWW